MILDTTKPLENLVTNKNISYSAYSDIKIVRKNNYSFSICNDIDIIKMFYHSYYLPMIHDRHEDVLLYTPPFVFFIYLKEMGYKLLLINDKDTSISGVFFHESKKELFIRYAGIKDGDTKLLKKGASAAHYYYSILYAKEKGQSHINVGAARPFFTDGVFQYKRKWGYEVVKADGLLNPEICGMVISPKCSQLKQFLINNPIIGVNKQYEPMSCFFFENKKYITKEKMKKIKEQYKTSGVNIFKFISFDED